MAISSKRGDPSFHLQAGAVLGATAGLAVGSAAPRTVTFVLMGAAALAFLVWFRGSLWPLITRTRLYESFFGIAGPAPVTYIREGIAGGLVAGGALGIVVGMFSTLVTSLLVWAGLGLLVARYMDSLHEFVAALRGIGAVRRGSAYKRLLARVRGDKALAKRLVEYEARRTPEAGREELAERALDRLERDSR